MEESLDECERPCDTLSCLLFFFPVVASVRLFYIGAGNPISKKSRSHMFYDVLVQCCHMPTSRTHVLGLASLTLLPDPILQDPRFLLRFPAANNNSMLFQLLYVPAGDRMLSEHNRRLYNVLQGGMDVAPSFPKACDVLLGTPGALLDLFSPVKGTENSNLNISKDSLTQTT